MARIEGTRSAARSSAKACAASSYRRSTSARAGAFADACVPRMTIMSSSYEPTSATAGQATTAGTDETVPQTVDDAGRERRRDAQAEQPPRQRRDLRRAEHHHRTRVDQPVHRERNQPGRLPRFSMRPHPSVGMLIRRHRRDRSDNDHG